MSTWSLVKQTSNLSDFLIKLVLESYLLWILYLVDWRMTYFLAQIPTSPLISLLCHILVNRPKGGIPYWSPTHTFLLSCRWGPGCLDFRFWYFSVPEHLSWPSLLHVLITAWVWCLLFFLSPSESSSLWIWCRTEVWTLSLDEALFTMYTMYIYLPGHAEVLSFASSLFCIEKWGRVSSTIQKKYEQLLFASCVTFSILPTPLHTFLLDQNHGCILISSKWPALALLGW